MTTSTPVGVLVGGKGRRMGGVHKPLLTLPDSGQTVLSCLLGVTRQVGLSSLLIGADRAYDADYPHVPRLTDEPAGIGPMGGLGALLRHAGDGQAIMLAGDMPYLTAPLLEALVSTPSGADVLAARDPQTGKWYPFFARYQAPRVLPVLLEQTAKGVRSFQTLFRGLQVAELALEPQARALLRDWDRPEDRARPLPIGDK